MTRFVTVGESSASPSATVRIAAMSCSGGVVLEHEPARAGSERLVDVLVEIEGGQDQDPSIAVRRQDASSRLEPVELGHADVHQDDRGMESRRLVHGLEPVARLGDDFDLLFAGEQHAEAGADHRLVVGDENTDRHGLSSAIGSRVLRTNPPSGAVLRGHLAAVDLDAFADADETMPETIVRGGAARRCRGLRAASPSGLYGTVTSARLRGRA